MGYTLGQAARAVGMSKTSILRSIRAGRISGTKDEFGQWSIEPCELHRIYPALTDVTDANGEGGRAVTVGDTGALAEANARAALAEARLLDLKLMLEDMRSGVEDVKRDRDEWRTQAQTLRLALPKPETAPPPPPVSGWRWLRSTGLPRVIMSQTIVVMIAGALIAALMFANDWSVGFYGDEPPLSINR